MSNKFQAPKIELAFFIGDAVCGILPKFFSHKDEYCIEMDASKIFTGIVKSMKIDIRGDVSLKVVSTNGKIHYVNQEFCFPLNEENYQRMTREEFHVFKINPDIDFDALTIRNALKEDYEYRYMIAGKNSFTQSRLDSFNSFFNLHSILSVSVARIPYGSFIELYR